MKREDDDQIPLRRPKRFIESASRGCIPQRQIPAAAGYLPNAENERRTTEEDFNEGVSKCDGLSAVVTATAECDPTNDR